MRRPGIILDDIEQDAGDDGVLVATVTREDHREVGRLRCIRRPGSTPYLLVVMLGSERQGVVDAVGVSVHRLVLLADIVLRCLSLKLCTVKGA
jgi:hypothetical protein